MKLIINPKIFKNFPELNLGVIVAKNINNIDINDEIQTRIRNEKARIQNDFTSTETLSQHPNIACWRTAYKSFGVKPKEYKSSVESLYRRVIKGENLRPINKIVDLYNLISLKYMVPVGGEDLNKIQGDLQLTFAEANEPAVKLLGDSEPKQPKEGEIFYQDDLSAVCRRWNWKEAERTKLTEDTKNCVIVIEGLPPVTSEEIKTATKETTELVKKFCDGNIGYDILNKAKTEHEI